jgi:hypothetical protein
MIPTDSHYAGGGEGREGGGDSNCQSLFVFIRFVRKNSTILRYHCENQSLKIQKDTNDSSKPRSGINTISNSCYNVGIKDLRFDFVADLFESSL